MTHPTTLALKVDVDTYEGMRRGVPNLLTLFRDLGIHATFFIPFGPDNSGKAIRRFFTQPGFLKKMLRTRAVRLYGWRTILSGTVLPARPIGASFPGLVRQLRSDGHEVGLHGHDHVRWQDELDRLSEEDIAGDLTAGAAAYAQATGARPTSTAAPGWRCNAKSLAVQQALGFTYHSDTRGTTPYFPVLEGQRFQTLEIPTTLPTLDELLGTDGLEGEALTRRLLGNLRPNGLNVLTVHTEVEGTALLEWFREFLLALRRAGIGIKRLEEIASQCLEAPQTVPSCSVVRRNVPGRAGVVSCQGPVQPVGFQAVTR
ncbi:MAG: 4-deoxy-4-formamido-L-arabinose-phosphoundecaprenol deformylase [Elusimicrobia bacterium]|nr:4-deoxy-4-formamido-L-arabinose-phosphoundecaprenol deformylase [Elusimicrobiota bacterium]